MVSLSGGFVVADCIRLGDSLSDVFAKWERLLQMVIERDPSFLAVLTEVMVNELAFTAVSDSRNDPNCEGLYMWLDHMLTSSQWEPSRRLFSFAYVVAVCDENSGHWTELLRERLRKAGLQPTSISNVQRQGERRENAPTPDATQATGDSNELKKYGWEFPDNWDSRPLGIV